MDGGYYPPPVQSTPRVMRESATDTTLLTSDGGIIMTAAGTVTAGPFDPGQLGNLYNIKNVSSGDVTVNSAAGEFLQEATGNITTFTLPSNFSISLGRNGSNTSNWIVQ